LSKNHDAHGRATAFAEARAGLFLFCFSSLAIDHGADRYPLDLASADYFDRTGPV
jgi:hypothetical protein